MPGDRLLGEQLPVALDVQPRLLEGRDVPVEGGLRLVGHRLVIARIDQEQQIVPQDVCALPVRLLADVPLDLGSDVRVDEPVEGRDPLAVERYVHLLDVGDLDDGRWLRRSCSCLVASRDRDQGSERSDSRVHYALRHSRCVPSGESGRPVSDEVRSRSVKPLRFPAATSGARSQKPGAIFSPLNQPGCMRLDRAQTLARQQLVVIRDDNADWHAP